MSFVEKAKQGRTVLCPCRDGHANFISCDNAKQISAPDGGGNSGAAGMGRKNEQAREFFSTSVPLYYAIGKHIMIEE
jgi:hypothetical protein